MAALEGLILFLAAVETGGLDLTTEPGHLKPFGYGRPSHGVEELTGFPDPKQFFKNFVLSSKPLKMKQAAKLSPAFNLWTDDYFLSLDTPTNSTVSVETMKKENRSQNVLDMDFKEFVKIYNNSQHYMVNPVPDFLGSDIVLPCSLQCADVFEKNLVATMMWFSSGGTKSVVHTDAVDNINCLYRGSKQFVMVDPSKYSDQVPLDHPEGSYSGVDVDSVDYTKYPGLAEVEFYHVNMTAGDCLYIPYRWIHQVRSYNSNLAVNVWWDHHNSVKIDLEMCDQKCDPRLTLENVKIQGFQAILNQPKNIKDHFVSILTSFKEVNFETLLKIFDMRFDEGTEDLEEEFENLMKSVFDTLDFDGNGVVSKSDIENLPDLVPADADNNKAWETLQVYMWDIDAFQQKLAEADGSEEDPEISDNFRDEL